MRRNRGGAAFTAAAIRRQAVLQLLLAATLLASPAGAQQLTPHPRWELGAGVATLSMPDYRGADGQRSYIFPVPYVVYRGEVLKVDREKVRGLLFTSEHLELDVSFNGSAPVASSDNRARAGLRDLGPTLEVGPRLNVKFFDTEKFRLLLTLPWRGVLEVDRAGMHDAGWLVNPTLNLDIKNTGPDKGWNLGLSGGPLWGDARYHDFFYGVAPADAAPDRPAYAARSGYSGAQITLAISKRYPRFWVGAFLRVNDLHGAVFEESPLLESKTGYLAGCGVSWILARSPQEVLSEE